jgi:hypothetical protein
LKKVNDNAEERVTDGIRKVQDIHDELKDVSLNRDIISKKIETLQMMLDIIESNNQSRMNEIQKSNELEIAYYKKKSNHLACRSEELYSIARENYVDKNRLKIELADLEAVRKTLKK